LGRGDGEGEAEGEGGWEMHTDHALQRRARARQIWSDQARPHDGLVC
jgi:hypothetical protein